MCVCWGRRQERDCCELCSSIPTLVSSLLLSHTIISAPSIFPPSYCGGQGGEERGQMGWNEVHLHYLLPPLPFHSSPPISPSIPSCPPLAFWHRLPSSLSLGLAPGLCGGGEAERTSLLPNPTGGHQLEAEPVHGPAQPGPDEAAPPMLSFVWHEDRRGDSQWR